MRAMGTQIQLNPEALDHVRSNFSFATGKSAQARKQLADMKWLSQIIIRSMVKSLNPIRVIAERSKHEYRREDSGAPHISAGRQSVLSREHDIEDDDIV